MKIGKSSSSSCWSHDIEIGFEIENMATNMKHKRVCSTPFHETGRSGCALRVRKNARLSNRTATYAKMSPDASVELKDGIAKFYDESSTVWENIWGEHMHHGYYGEQNVGQLTIDEHRKAQVLMIDKVKNLDNHSI